MKRAALAAFLLGALLYANTAVNGFVFDDIDVAQRNPNAQNPLALGTIFSSHYWAGVQPKGNLYRPLTILTLALNHTFSGEGPAGYHITNALLHGAVSALVILLAAGLGCTTPGALMAGILFAAHPVHVEAVAPVVGRSELLAALFSLAAWLCHLRATRERLSAGARVIATTASAVLFAAAVFSKENAAVLPALILAGDLTLRRFKGRRFTSFASLGAQTIVLAVFFAARAAVVGGGATLAPDGIGSPLDSVFGGIDTMTRWMTAMGVLGRYLWLMVFPLHLSADYSFEQIPLIHSPADPLFLASMAAYLGLAAAGFLLAARGRRSGLGILIYLGALFPVSNLPFSIGAVMGERLLYLPSLGLCVLAAALVEEARSRRDAAFPLKPVVAAVAVVCLILGARTAARNLDWRDQETLFRVTVETSPRSAKAHYNLGVVEDERGNITAAMQAYRQSIEIKPDQAQPRRNYGLDLLAERRPAEALEYLSSAASLDPAIPDVFSDVGIALHQLGRASEAEQAFGEELKRRPGSWRAWYNLGSLLLDQNRPAEAIDALSRCIAINPSDPDARAQIGSALAVLGRNDEAIAAFSEALRLAPRMRELLVPLARSAIALGLNDLAGRALGEARAAGVQIPGDLRGWTP